jgi:hypothetical protein
MRYNISSSVRSGQAVLTTVLFLLVVSMALLFSFSSIALKETNASRLGVESKQSYFLAEAGIEDVTWRIKNNKQYASSEIFSMNGSNATITVLTNSGQKTIRSQGLVSGAVRAVATTLRTGVGASFSYGIQVGQGGLQIENSATINGSVYSLGNIWGGGSGAINGDAFVGGTGVISDPPKINGNAWAHTITDAAVSGSATSTTSISGSTIGVNAYANTVTGNMVSGTVNYCGSQSQNTIGRPPAIGSCPAPSDLPLLPLPISDSDVANFEDAAEAGGEITTPCPYVLTSGTTTLGPAKIMCDLTVKNSAVVIVAGPLWIVGNLAVQNSAVLKLPVSAGSGSGVIVVDNPANRTISSKITVANTAALLGSGDPKSYLMLVSQNNSAELGGSEVAIVPSQNTNGSIYYAGHGALLIQNSTQGNSTSLREASAYLIHMENSAILSYEQGLADITFSTGPTGGWNIQSWSEVK